MALIPERSSIFFALSVAAASLPGSSFMKVFVDGAILGCTSGKTRGKPFTARLASRAEVSVTEHARWDFHRRFADAPGYEVSFSGPALFLDNGLGK